MLSEKTKHSLKILAKAAIGLAIFWVVAVFVPDDSLFKKMFKGLMGVSVIGMFLWGTGLLRKILNFFKKK